MGSLKKIEEQIICSLRKLVVHPSFESFYEKNRKPKIIQLNNSFIHRDVKTNKNELHLFLKMKDNSRERFDIYVGKEIGQNLNFKPISEKSTNKPDIRPIEEVINEEIKKLGKILYVLIAKVKDDVHLKKSVNCKEIRTVNWIPQQKIFFIYRDNEIYINNISDREKIWSKIEENNAIVDRENTKKAIFIALDGLEKQAVARIVISEKSEDEGLLDQVVKALKKHREEYVELLDQHTQNINELRRIAYNFATDVLTYLNLIVSICDLKPIVLWGTIGEHFCLSEAFRNLSCFDNKIKPSLKGYRQIISDERNESFHRIISLNKTLKLELPPEAIGYTEITFFPNMGIKKIIC